MRTSEATSALPLPVVDARRLEKRYRDALDPGGFLCDRNGRARQLPRYFYEVPSWTAALELEVTPHFKLWEFVHTDVREAEPLRSFPRYVPCAVTLLAVCLERFREAVNTYVHIAANGGYRSPRHRLTGNASPHCWAAAVDIYRVGDTHLDDRQAIERYAEIAREALPGVWTQPYGPEPDGTDDHLHLDIGYVVSIPRDAPGDAYIAKLDWDPI